MTPPNIDHAKTTLRDYLAFRIQQLSPRKQIALVAEEAGNSVGLLERFATGTRFPLHMVEPLAAVLEVDCAFLFRLAMEQFQTPELTAKVLAPGLTYNEAK